MGGCGADGFWIWMLDLVMGLWGCTGFWGMVRMGWVGGWLRLGRWGIRDGLWGFIEGCGADFMDCSVCIHFLGLGMEVIGHKNGLDG